MNMFTFKLKGRKPKAKSVWRVRVCCGEIHCDAISRTLAMRTDVFTIQDDSSEDFVDVDVISNSSDNAIKVTDTQLAKFYRNKGLSFEILDTV
jgi:hypothetical protein